MLTVFLYLVIFPTFTFSQFLSYDAIRMRVPGRCMQGDFDCGLGQCVPISQFRDGKPDCIDGSDEWCFIGQVSCGPVYCADYKDALPCIVYPKCDGSSKQLPWCTASKEKLCADKKSFPCKGYGECVLWEWLLDGKKDCIDGSDEDENYVMPLEHAYRCARNQTGLYLPKPIPPPPEDHPSLYVEGCSFCPNNGKVQAGPLPTDPVVDHTTPRYPFGSFKPPENTQETFGGTSDEEKQGEFFPAGVEISRVTQPQTPETQQPNEPIGDFFPTFSTNVPPTESSTQSHTFRVITIPSIGRTQFPKAPLIFPMRPDLPPITAPSPLNNWPIPIVTSTPESHPQGSLPPITYPHGQESSEKIPPIRPGIIISRPLTSVAPSEYEMGGMPPGIDPFESSNFPTVAMPDLVATTLPPLAGFRPITRLVDNGYGSSEYGGENAAEKYGIQKPSVDTLVPLLPGHILPNVPTRKPLTIPSYFTFSTTPSYPSFPSPHHVTHKPDYVGMPTLIPDSEIDKYVQTVVPPSSVPQLPDIHSVAPGDRQTAPPQGFIEETTPSPDNHGARQTEIPTENSLPETTTFPNPKTTSFKNITHVGPNGIIEDQDKTEHGEHTEKPDDTEGQVVTGTDKIIHIGGSTAPNSETFTSSSTFAPPTTAQSSTSETTLQATSVGDPQIDSCIRKMLDGSLEQSPVCDCPNGQFRSTPDGNCEETLSLMNVKVNINTICNSGRLSQPEKLRILHKKIGMLYQSCMHPSAQGSSIVATIRCDDCSLSDINRVITTRSFGEPGNLNVTTEGFGSSLCSDFDYNHCHVYSDCIVDKEGLRYSCRCKKGTTDSSNGYGRQCDGFPEESDCIMVFGICLIVWLLFLLGAFMLSLLSCIACYTLCRQRCCRQIAIHPMNADGLQTVVIGPKAAQSMDANKEKMPHMKAIFAESLKHSAKGSTSVASAFALADFRRKKVSRPPEMSQVTEEVNENTTVPIPVSESLPKISSLAKISTHTANSEPPTPVGVIETPILEKNSSSVSLVSVNDNAPQLPSLPLPLPVPITTSASTTNLEEKGEKEKEREGGPGPQEQQVAETERPASSHSIGVQPTIWETYRVLGQQYSKTDLTERKSSVDSLEKMFEARLAETARTTRTIPTVRTDKSDSSAIMFTVKPQKDETEKPPAIVESKELLDVEQKPPEVTKEAVEEIQKNVEDANENTLKETDSKLADMIGVTSFHTSRAVSPSRPDSAKERTAIDALLKDSDTSSLEKSLEAALLIEMARSGIELPLSPRTPVPTSDELEKVVAQKNIPFETVDSDVIPVKPKPESPKKGPESRKSSAKSIASSRKSKIPSVSPSRVGSAKQRSQIDEQDIEPDMFVPQGSRAIHAKKNILRRSGSGELVPSTDESDPEIAFFKRLEKIKKEAADRHTPFHPGRKYSRRRKPERTLSSISEKSAEIAAEAALEYPVDTSISCPPTTRSFLEPRGPPVRRFVIKRKVIEATEETSDVDLPKLKPAKPIHPIVSSPEIPDVTFQRSMENLHKTEMDSKPETLVSSRLGSAKKSSLMKKKPNKAGAIGPSSSVQSSRHSSKFGSKSTTPRNGDDTPLSHTSRSTRHSVISRKIAVRRHELKAVSGSAHDLSRTSPVRPSATHTIRGAKSVEDLSKRRPHWDISPYRDTPGPSTFLPPITPSRSIRTAVNSPQPRHRRSDSHFSMTSLPLIAHSPTSFWSSPHFNPSQDSRKPPKEDLWWNPNKRL